MRIKNAVVYDSDGVFRRHDIYISGGVFTEAEAGGQVIDAEGLTALPGLVDIHFHGCAGADVSDGQLDGLRRMYEYETKNGVTALVPAAMTLPEAQLMNICRAAREAAAAGLLDGINLEGPFLAKAKIGSQNPKYLMKPDIPMMERLLAAGGGLIRLVTIAPEEDGAADFARAFRDRVCISMGHTGCNYDTAREMMALGVSHVTHFYNAMSGFSHREPGLVGAVFDSEACAAELICDGIHVHPAAIRTAFRLLGDKRIILISDSMRAAGLGDGDYTLGGLDVTVRGRRAVLTGTDVLAGSVTNLADCLRFAVREAGIPLASAVRCATENPAKEAGIFDSCGSISPGKRADLLLVDENLDTRAVYLKGSRIA